MWLKVKTKLSNIRGLEHSAAFFNIRNNTDVPRNEQYEWDILLKSFKKYGYNPTRFKNGWIRVSPLGRWEYNDTNTIKEFLLSDGHHRIAICKHLYGDNYIIEVILATHGDHDVMAQCRCCRPHMDKHRGIV